MFSAYDATVPVVVRNPLSRAISVTIGNSTTVSIPSNQTAFTSVVFSNLGIFSSPQSTKLTVPVDITASTPVTILVQITDIGNLTLTTTLLCDYPVVVYPLIASNTTLIFNFSNPTGHPFNGSFVVAAFEYSVSFISGQDLVSVVVPFHTSNVTGEFYTSNSLQN
jgi:hypothetical protein